MPVPPAPGPALGTPEGRATAGILRPWWPHRPQTEAAPSWPAQGGHAPRPAEITTSLPAGAKRAEGARAADLTRDPWLVPLSRFFTAHWLWPAWLQPAGGLGCGPS